MVSRNKKSKHNCTQCNVTKDVYNWHNVSNIGWVCKTCYIHLSKKQLEDKIAKCEELVKKLSCKVVELQNENSALKGEISILKGEKS
jgi:hypothetical protein